MRKLKLEIADLEVVSFQTDIAQDKGGTVEGYKTVSPTDGHTCPEYPSCDPYVQTCNDAATCAPSCGDTCYDGCGSHYSGCPVCVID
jgi:hypothetical protein